jgi:hypothetical protein
VFPRLHTLAHMTVVLFFWFFSQIKRLHSEQSNVDFPIVTSRTIWTFNLLGLCWCTDVNGVIWAVVLRATYTFAASIALKVGSCRPFGLLAFRRMLRFVCSSPNSKGIDICNLVCFGPSVGFQHQNMKAFRALISSMFMKSLEDILWKVWHKNILLPICQHCPPRLWCYCNEGSCWAL